jgi:hypothetical protein
MTERTYPKIDPRNQTQVIKQALVNLAIQCREDVSKIDEPRAQALLETTRETLLGLATAYDHYAEGKKAAWRR